MMGEVRFQLSIYNEWILFYIVFFFSFFNIQKNHATYALCIHVTNLALILLYCNIWERSLSSCRGIWTRLFMHFWLFLDMFCRDKKKQCIQPNEEKNQFIKEQKNPKICQQKNFLLESMTRCGNYIFIEWYCWVG